MPTLDHVAAVFTIVGGSLALIQLTAILVRLNRRPRLLVRIGAVQHGPPSDRNAAIVQVITANAGSLSARNILWNYDFPPGFRISSSEGERHTRGDRVTLVRALDHLHPQVEIRHEFVVETPGDQPTFPLQYRIHLEDAPAQSGSLPVAVPASPTAGFA